MSLTGGFNTQHGVDAVAGSIARAKRPAPFSLRFSDDERARLVRDAAGVPLGTYIKAKVFGTEASLRQRRTGLAIEDRQAVAQVLALLGSNRLANNLNQLAHAANIGTLPMTPETEAELLAAFRDVRAIRHLLLTALGMRPEGTS